MIEYTGGGSWEYYPSLTAPKSKCVHCGHYGGHDGVCPNVKAIEYYPNGTVKRVEYK